MSENYSTNKSLDKPKLPSGDTVFVSKRLPSLLRPIYSSLNKGGLLLNVGDITKITDGLFRIVWRSGGNKFELHFPVSGMKLEKYGRMIKVKSSAFDSAFSHIAIKTLDAILHETRLQVQSGEEVVRSNLSNLRDVMGYSRTRKVSAKRKTKHHDTRRLRELRGVIDFMGRIQVQFYKKGEKTGPLAPLLLYSNSDHTYEIDTEPHPQLVDDLTKDPGLFYLPLPPEAMKVRTSSYPLVRALAHHFSLRTNRKKERNIRLIDLLHGAALISEAKQPGRTREKITKRLDEFVSRGFVGSYKVDDVSIEAAKVAVTPGPLLEDLRQPTRRRRG